MKKRNILMCLQQLEIGGVETAVLTLCKGYKRAGHNVFVAAKNGIFSEQLEKMGVKILNINYEICQTFPLENQEILKTFVKENNITEIHIHQYPCILYWLPICIELKIPYIAYVHSIVKGAPEWFMEISPIYKYAFPIFFTYASKIICIAEKSKKEIENLFPIPKDKFIIIKNSINMEDFQLKKPSKEILKFGIVSRLAEEKELSIKRAIDLFNEYNRIKPNSELLIAGDGPYKKIFEEYSSNKNIKFVGAISKVSKFMNEIDIFLGVDRCILESCACKCLSVISGYEGNICLLDKKNIEEASKVNFSGMNLPKTENIINILISMNENQYKNIVDENYKFINKYYNIDNNLYNEPLSLNIPNEYKYIIPILKEQYENYYKERIKIIELENKKITNRIKNLYKKIMSFIKRIIKKILISLKLK